LQFILININPKTIPMSDKILTIIYGTETGNCKALAGQVL